MLVRPSAERPMEFAIFFPDGKIIDAGKAPGHETICLKFPVLVAVGAKPIFVFITPLISKADGDPIFTK